MSYKFGQFRKTQKDEYMEDLKYNFSKLKTKSGISENVWFWDRQAILTNKILQSTNQTGTALKSYYLRFRVYKQELEQSLKIKLFNTELEVDNEQTIETITVAAGDNTDYDTFEIIIQPNANYNAIYFILDRIATDYLMIADDGSYGRIPVIEIEKFTEILNVIESISGSIDNKTALKQIGIQSRPGLLMSINGEGIKVGRSGIYEINNGVMISSIGFVLDKNDNTYFIMDYQY